MGYGVSTATATQNPLEFAAGTAINFGAGYIDDPNSQTQTPDQRNTASTPGGNGSVGTTTGSEGTVAGLTPTQLIAVAGIGAVVLLAGVFLIVRK